MSITKTDVEHIAKLARIEVKEEDKEKLAQELGAILDYVAKLNEVDTEGVEPTAQVTGLENIFRKDEVSSKNEDSVAKLLAAMPTKEGRHLKVKSVFEHK